MLLYAIIFIFITMLSRDTFCVDRTPKDTEGDSHILLCILEDCLLSKYTCQVSTWNIIEVNAKIQMVHRLGAEKTYSKKVNLWDVFKAPYSKGNLFPCATLKML